MAQTFLPFRHRHSLLPEVVREGFSNVAALLYVLLECDHWVCFTGSSLDLEKIFGRDLYLEVRFASGLQELGLSEYLEYIYFFIFVCVSVCLSFQSYSVY